eukprot:gene7112-440_t
MNVLVNDRGRLSDLLDDAYHALRDFRQVCDVRDRGFLEDLSELIDHLDSLRSMTGIG